MGVRAWLRTAYMAVRFDQEKLQMLKFRTREDAERFAEFLRTFVRESGAGNGYGSYWPIPGVRILALKPMRVRSVVGMLDARTVERMERRIVGERLGLSRHEEASVIRLTGGDEGITFEIGTLPERQRPEPGDTYRDLARDASPCREGRVIAIIGDVAVVKSVLGEHGVPGDHESEFVLPIDRLMRTRDPRKEDTAVTP